MMEFADHKGFSDYYDRHFVNCSPNPTEHFWKDVPSNLLAHQEGRPVNLIRLRRPKERFIFISSLMQIFGLALLNGTPSCRERPQTGHSQASQESWVRTNDQQNANRNHFENTWNRIHQQINTMLCCPTTNFDTIYKTWETWKTDDCGPKNTHALLYNSNLRRKIDDLRERVRGKLVLALIIGSHFKYFYTAPLDAKESTGQHLPNKIFELLDRAVALPENAELVRRASLSIQSAWPFSRKTSENKWMYLELAAPFVNIFNLPDTAVACAIRHSHSLDQLLDIFSASAKQIPDTFSKVAREEYRSKATPYLTSGQKLDLGLRVLVQLKETPDGHMKDCAMHSLGIALLRATNRVDDMDTIQKITGTRIPLEQRQRILEKSVHRLVEDICNKPT